MNSFLLRGLRRFVTQPGIALLAWWALALSGLSQQSMWIDEWFTWLRARDAWSELIDNVIASERRPPLQYALEKFWAQVIAGDEFAMRIMSVSMVMIGGALIYTLGRRLLGEHAGIWAIWLLACSPFWLLYGRMIRAYSMTMCLALFLTFALLRAVERGRLWWAIYGMAGIALLYTDYSGLAVIGAHGFYMLGMVSQQGWRKLVVWSGMVLVIGVGFLPWLAATSTHIGREVRITDLAEGPVGIALKLLAPFYSWGAGESIYPWHPLGAAAVLVAGLLWLWGLATAWHSRRQAFWLLLAGFVMPLLFTATLLTLIATDITFLNAAARSPAASPFFYLTVAGGIVGLRRPPVRWLAAGLLFAGFAAASLNYFQASQLLNPIHVVPARDVAATLAEEAAPGDLIVGESDTLVGHYYTLRPGAATYQDVAPDDNLSWISANAPQVVYLATFGRDSTANSYGTEELTSWLAEHYTLQAEQGYAPVDPVYQAFKSRLTGRPAYVYKLMVQKYVRP